MDLINKNVESIDPAMVTQLKLADGTLMPQAAMGTFHSDNPDLEAAMEDIIIEAIRLGYRHLDCATAYQNEEVVGRAISKAIESSLVIREELFVLSKLWNKNMKPEEVIPALEQTLKDLGLEYLDMYLVHWPWPNYHEPGSAGDAVNAHAVPYIHEDFMKVWEKMTELKKSGKVKNIGTSNQTQKTMELLLRDTDHFNRPSYNQMELHPLFQQQDFVKYLISEKVVPSGYMSLGSPRRPGRDRFAEHQADMLHPIIQQVAGETGMTPPEVCLSWAHQREQNNVGYVAMAERSEWIKSNLACATKEALSNNQYIKINGDGSDENLGINTNNRLIWGQVFFWPEARLLGHDRDLLWNDVQIFETELDYHKFSQAAVKFYEIWKETAVDLRIKYS
jgi:alcohol dehydrogenase (NADP+)|tara:strand:+ start:486 stop:1661 length:1176 start_codon:yes stop_codon:yes gene_type:complete